MKAYRLKQVKAAQGINSHRAWRDQISGQKVYSNDDIIGDYKFYMDEGESHGTIWYRSPSEAIAAYWALGLGAVRCTPIGIKKF